MFHIAGNFNLNVSDRVHCKKKTEFSKFTLPEKNDSKNK